jgi:hypothetical protein
MSEHLLYGTQIGAILQQMGGKRVPEGMGADGLANSTAFCQFLYYSKNHRPTQRPSPTVKEEYIFGSLFNGLVNPYMVFI